MAHYVRKFINCKKENAELRLQQASDVVKLVKGKDRGDCVEIMDKYSKA